MTATLHTAARCPDCGQVISTRYGVIVDHARPVERDADGDVVGYDACVHDARAIARDDARAAVVARVQKEAAK